MVREGKKITFYKKGIVFQKPTDTVELMTTFIEKKSKKIALIRTTKIRKTEVKIARELELWILNMVLPNIIIIKY